MSDSPRRLRGMSVTTVVVLVLTTAVSTAVIAAHNFNDVPDSNTFHEDIEWLSENRVTRGCNPPANDEFCPSEDVTREEMAAFMRRLAETSGVAGNQVTDDSDPVTVDSTNLTELLSVSVTPMADAEVILNAHATIEIETGADGQFEVVIARDSCDGTVVGSGTWVTTDVSVTQSSTVSVTGSDQVTETTTYALCTAKGDAASQDGTVLQRGLIGNWAPITRSSS